MMRCVRCLEIVSPVAYSLDYDHYRSHKVYSVRNGVKDFDYASHAPCSATLHPNTPYGYVNTEFCESFHEYYHNRGEVPGHLVYIEGLR